MRVPVATTLCAWMACLLVAGSVHAEERKAPSLVLTPVPATAIPSQCPAGTARDEACVDRAGGDPQALASCPCTATKAETPRIDAKAVRQAGVRPALPPKSAPVLHLQPAPAPTCGLAHAACGNVCKDLRTDPSNCGRCGNACISGYRCESGVCIAPVSR